MRQFEKEFNKREIKIKAEKVSLHSEYDRIIETKAKQLKVHETKKSNEFLIY